MGAVNGLKDKNLTGRKCVICNRPKRNMFMLDDSEKVICRRCKKDVDEIMDSLDAMRSVTQPMQIVISLS